MNRFILFSALMIATGCNGSSAPRPARTDSQPAQASPGGVTTRVDSSGRYPVLTSNGEAARGTIEPLFTVRDGFDNVRTALLDPAGGVWILDQGARRLSHYDDRGQRGTTISRAGSGNGEFSNPYSLAWGAGDLMVYDPGNSRVGRWSPDGSWQGSWRAVPITGGVNARFFPSGSSSSAWLFQFSFLSSGQPAPGFARFPLTPRGDVRWIPPTQRGAIQDVVICSAGGAQQIFPAPFVTGEIWQPSLDGQLLYLRGVDYAIATVDSAGDTLRVMRRDVPRIAIADAEWESAAASLEAFRKANPGACNGSFTRPLSKAVARALTLDDRGRMWVERVTADGFLWEVWEGDQLLGAVPGVERDPLVPIDVRGERIAVVTRGADDRHEVQVLRYALPAGR